MQCGACEDEQAELYVIEGDGAMLCKRCLDIGAEAYEGTITVEKWKLEERFTMVVGDDDTDDEG
jgi:hypothetical protein